MIMQDSLWSMAALAATVFLILLFLRAGWHKVADYGRFLGFVADYRLLPERLVEPVARLLIGAEFAVVALLAWPSQSALGAAAAAALLSLYALAIGVNVARGRRRIDCGCGGTAQSLSWSLVIRNALLAALALLAAAGGSRLLGAYAAAAAVFAGVLVWFAYNLVEQVIANGNRRLLLNSANQAKH